MMSRKVEQIENFFKKFREIPSIGLADFEGEITYSLWFNRFKDYPKVFGKHIKELSDFSSSPERPLKAFSELKDRAVLEIENYLLESSNKFELEKYFILIKDRLNYAFLVSKINVKRLENINFDLSLEEFQNLNPDEKVNCFIFYNSALEIKFCCQQFLDLQAFIEEKETLYLGNPELIELSKIEMLSDSLSHKILLLHELGIIEYLQSEYFHPKQSLRNATDLARLISTIIDEPLKIETIRKNISGINSKGKDSIVTKPAIKKVKTFLSQFNITLQRLKDKD